MESSPGSTLDVVIVGGGLAGLGAALTLVRARRSVVVIDAGQPRNAPAAHAHGYLTRDGPPPLQLLTWGRAEVRGYGGTIVEDTVDGITRLADGRLVVSTRSGARQVARRSESVIRSTRMPPDSPASPGMWVAGNVLDVTAGVMQSAASGVTAAATLNAHLTIEDAEKAVEAASLN